MRARNWALLLLVVPFIAVLYPPFYAALQPEWEGIPYFIWYQFLWAIISSVLTIIVYLIREPGEPRETPSTRGPDEPAPPERDGPAPTADGRSGTR
jgi:uncharacterized RDD family membrane protein YckC